MPGSPRVSRHLSLGRASGAGCRPTMTGMSLTARFRGPFARWPRRLDAVLAAVLFLLTAMVGTQVHGDSLGPGRDACPVRRYWCSRSAAATSLRRRQRPLAVLGVAAGRFLVLIVLPYGPGRHSPVLVVALQRRPLRGRRQAGAVAVPGRGRCALRGHRRLVRSTAWGEIAFGVGSSCRSSGTSGGRCGSGERACRSSATSGRRGPPHHRRGAHPHRPRTPRRGRPPGEHDDGAGRCGHRPSPPPIRRRPGGRWPRSSRPAGRRSTSCGTCSACCGPDRARTGGWPATGARRPAPPARPGPRGGARGRGRHDACRTACRSGCSCRRTASSRRRSTNVLKHGGPARGPRSPARTATATSPSRSSTTRPGRARCARASGHGIIGMRERVNLLGGSLDTGPRPDGGFRVVAPSLPTRRGVRMTISVVVADDQALVRGGFAMILGAPRHRRGGGGRQPGSRRSTPRPAPSRRHPDGHPHARPRRARGDRADPATRPTGRCGS